MSTPEQNPPGIAPVPIPNAEREWLGSILALHPFPTLAVDATKEDILFANEAAQRLALAPAAIGKRDNIVHASDDRGVRIATEQLIPYLLCQCNKPEGVEITWHMPEQSYTFRVFIRAMPLRSGQTSLALVTFLDITREKSAEAELREALEARDEFFSVATHELKDPLFSLQLSIQLLHHAAEKLGEIPSHVRQHLEVSHRQADRLARLIDNLLDVSRIVNSRLILDLEALDLCELTREVVARMREKAEMEGTLIQADMCESLIGYFDRMKMEQILSNLLTNALKYGKGQPVTVRVQSQEDSAIVEVIDRGVGIATEDQERIFQRFERATDRHKKSSLGLGLYIVRSLVEAHGGTIRVRSEPGKGATFTVSLPKKRLPPTESVDGNQKHTRGG